MNVRSDGAKHFGWIDELYRRSIDADALIRETLVEGMASVAVFSMVILILAGDDVPIDWTYPKRSGWVQLLLNTTEDVHEFTTRKLEGKDMKYKELRLPGFSRSLEE